MNDAQPPLLPIKPTLRHYALGVVSLVITGLVGYTLYTLVPSVAPGFAFMRYSVISAAATAYAHLTGAPNPAAFAEEVQSTGLNVFLVLLVSVMFIKPALRQLGDKSGPPVIDASSPPRLEGVGGRALQEEIDYRRGAEHRTLAQNVWSALRFGSAHIFNLIVPLAVIPALVASGLWFTGIYLWTYRSHPCDRCATLEVGAAHAMHNTILFVSVPVGGFLYVGWTVWTTEGPGVVLQVVGIMVLSIIGLTLLLYGGSRLYVHVMRARRRRRRQETP